MECFALTFAAPFLLIFLLFPYIWWKQRCTQATPEANKAAQTFMGRDV